MQATLQLQAFQKIDLSSSLGQQWEALVQASTTSGIMQSLHWQDFKLSQGLRSVHLCVFQDERLIGGSILYTSPKSTGAGFLVAPEGPVLPWGDEPLAREALALIIDGAKNYAHELGAMALRIEPRLTPPLPRLLREFVRGPMDLIPSETLYVDLTSSTEGLLLAMKPKGRYNIKLSQKHGVIVKEDTSASAAALFYKMVKEASIRDRFALEPFSFFQDLIGVLAERKCLRLFFAEHAGDTLGAALLTIYGARATYLYGGISDTKRNLMGGYALQWAAIEAAKQAGCTTYDFYGFDPFRSPEHLYARFSQFKSRFGGEAIRHIGAHDYYFTDHVADAFVKLVSEADQRRGNQATFERQAPVAEIAKD